MSKKAALDSAEANAVGALDDFETQYIGARASAPATDADGDPLITGALYYNTSNTTMFVYTGTAWDALVDNLVVDPNATITSNIATNGNDIKFGDNDKATFGASDDLQIYHDGTDSFVSDAGTGRLRLRGSSQIRLETASGTQMISADDGGAAKLYHNGIKKLDTTSTGVDVTGAITADGLTVDGLSNMVGDRSSSVGGSTLIKGRYSADNHHLNLGSMYSNGENVLGFGVESSKSAANQFISTLSNYSAPRSALTSGESIHFFTAPAQNTAIGSPVAMSTRFKIANNGDVSFYEDTGTTAKMVWDASAEQLLFGNATVGLKYSDKLTLTSGSSNAGILLGSTNIYPYKNLDLSDNTIDIGQISSRFKNMYLSGGAYVGTLEAGSAGVTSSSAGGTARIVGAAAGAYFGSTTNTPVVFQVNQNEKARIDNQGTILVGKTNADIAVAGHKIESIGRTWSSVDGGYVAGFNRLTSDGDIVQFRKDGTTVGSIGADGGRPYFSRAEGGFSLSSNGHMIPATATGGVSDNARDLGLSVARWKDLYLSGGVYLGGTGAANKLDDYETGNFTPTTNSGTVTFSSANYVKVGDIVTIYINNIKFSDTTTSQTLRIESLPFAASGDSVGSVMAARVSPTEGFDSAYVGDGTGRIEFFADTSGGFTGTNRTSLTDGNSSLYIQVTYKAV